jgi:tetratricopeptide (TPR) repeat protein
MINDPEAAILIGKAMTYRDKSNLLQKYYIEALSEMIQKNYTSSTEIMEELIRTYPDEKFAYFWLGSAYRVILKKPGISISYFEKAIELDSLFTNAYEQLAAAYNSIGNDERSAWAIDRCIALAPEEPYPYYRKGLIYQARDEIDSAIGLYERALEKEPDYYHSYSRLVYLYLQKKEFDKAESCYRKLAEQPQKNLRSDARTGLAVVKLFQGKLDEALDVLNEGIAVDSLEQTYHGAEGDMANKYSLKAKIYLEKDSMPAAIEAIEKCMEACRKVVPLNIPCYLDDYVWILAESGRTSEAEKISEQLKTELEAAGEPLTAYWYARGHIDLASGNFEAAISYFKKASVLFALGRAYYAAGQYERAAAVYEEAVSRLSPYEAIARVKAHYYLALAYEQLDEPEEAAEQYGAFLDYWKNGDQWIEEIEDAVRRLSRLGGQTPNK